jgi:Domain of unknown function (DUF4878)
MLSRPAMTSPEPNLPAHGRPPNTSSISRRAVPPILLTLLSACAGAPESAVSGFYNAVEKNDIKEAKTFLSAAIISAIPDSKLDAGLASACQEIHRCGGIKSIESKLDGDGNTRKGMSTLVYNGNCPQKIDAVKVIKERGKWKLAPDK